MLKNKFLPMTKQEMISKGWDYCDIIIVTGDAYVDHPSFGMALIGRLLESHGFKVGIIAQPDWRSVDDFRKLGRPKLFFGITSGNMDSMVNHYTSERHIRSDDAYTPGGKAGKRPNRAVIVYSNRCREAYPDSFLVLGGIEAGLRRFAHYDYWSDQIRRSILADAKADLLIFGNAERAVVEIAKNLNSGKNTDYFDMLGIAFVCKSIPSEFQEIDLSNPNTPIPKSLPLKTIVRLPSYDNIKDNPLLFAHATGLVYSLNMPFIQQQHGTQNILVNQRPLPLSTQELDAVYELGYCRKPHPSYGSELIPAYDMIKNSVTILRGCFGGCSFCSISVHEGKVIQSRSERSILKEIETIRDNTDNFSGVISDLGGPTANMYKLGCRSGDSYTKCRRISCVYPKICKNLNTDHGPLVELYRKVRNINGISKVCIGSGIRYDLAVNYPEYIRELATYHVGGYLKVAPEHTEQNPLRCMMKPDIRVYEEFKKQFDKFSNKAGKKQYLIPYFIAAHPGTSDKDMLNLSLWLKDHKLKVDQVQTFLPSPMTLATAMYFSGRNPLNIDEIVEIPKGASKRTLHKSLLRYHDPKNKNMVRKAIKRSHHFFQGQKP